MFSVQELNTLVEQQLSMLVVVVDNGGYREIQDQEAARGIPPIGVKLRTPDLAALAVAMGAQGVRTTSTADLPDLVSAAPRRRRPDTHSLRHPLKGSLMDIAVVAIYLVGMIAFGFWGKRRATTQSDFLVAGPSPRSSGTMAAIVLGGASTIGGVGLGYKFASRACGSWSRLAWASSC